jgi:hypothetical protein
MIFLCPELPPLTAPIQNFIRVLIMLFSTACWMPARHQTADDGGGGLTPSSAPAVLDVQEMEGRESDGRH